jgi:beta-galactosidase
MFYKYIGGWGSKTTNFRIEGYIGEDKVKTILRENNKEYKYMMEMKRKTLEISSTYDALRVVVRKVNQNGETIPYSFDAIKINVSGSIDLIGPSLVNLQGGAIAFWVKTNGNRGIGTISIKADKEIMETIMVK